MEGGLKLIRNFIGLPGKPSLWVSYDIKKWMFLALCNPRS